MEIQYDSIGKAMQKILRDIPIQNISLKNDLIEWAAEAMDYIRTTHQLLPQHKDLVVSNYGAKLPCGIQSIQLVTYEGGRIRYGQSANNFDDVLPTRSYMNYWIARPPKIVPNEYHQIGMTYIQSEIEMLQAVSSYEVYNDLYYYTENGMLETNLESGDITIYFLGAQLDKEGFPLIPRNIFVLEAITNYVDYKLTRAGYKEGRWDILKQLWDDAAGRAVNNIEFPSPERIQSLMDATLGVIKPNYDEYEL